MAKYVASVKDLGVPERMLFGTRHHKRKWSDEELTLLTRLAQQHMTCNHPLNWEGIAYILGRTVAGVTSAAQKMGIAEFDKESGETRLLLD